MTRTVLGVALLARVAAAEPGLDQDRALGASPDPASPAFELGWRNGLRGEAGARIPILRHDDRLGFSLEIPAFIELHNDGAIAPVPYEYWRGHVGVMAAERWLAGAWTLRVHGVVEHESDHDLHGQWIYYEAIGGGFAATRALATVQLTLVAQAVLLVETCTLSVACTNQDGLGDASVQPSLAAIASYRRWFAALYADATPANGRVAGEARVIVHAGYALEAGTRGAWQFFAQLLGGREVGIDSVNGNELRFGAGVRWEP